MNRSVHSINSSPCCGERERKTSAHDATESGHDGAAGKVEFFNGLAFLVVGHFTFFREAGHGRHRDPD